MTKRLQFLIAFIYQVVLTITVLLAIKLNNNTNNFTSIFSAWDAHHYQYLAQYGYQTKGDEANFIVFFPLFPIFIKLFSYIVENYILSSLIITAIFSILGHFIYLLLVQCLPINNKQKILAIILFFLSPISIYFFAAYTESLYLFLVTSFFYLLIKKKYLIASVIGMFTGLTRNVGIILLVPLIVQLIINEKEKAIKYILHVIPIMLGPLFYLCLNYYLWRNFFYYQIVLANNWQKSVINPMHNLIFLLTDFPNHLRTGLLTYSIDLVSILLIILLIFLYLINRQYKIPASWIFWVVTNWLVVLSQSFLLSSARYLLILFPIYIILPIIIPKNKYLLFIFSEPLIVGFGLLAYHGINLYVKGAWLY